MYGKLIEKVTIILFVIHLYSEDCFIYPLKLVLIH